MFTKTNGHARDLLTIEELPQGIVEEWFEYVEPDDDQWSARFFEYRGSWYDTSDGFIPTPNLPTGVAIWQPESCFSAVGIRYVEDYSRVIVTHCHW